MTRKNRNTGDSGKTATLGDATRTAELTPITQPSGGGGGGSSMRGALQSSSLLQHPRYPLIPSPYGASYATHKARTIAADEYQAVVGKWKFDVKGYHDFGTPTAGVPDEIGAGSTLLADWYTYGRQMGKASLKYKHTPLALNDTSRVADLLNIAFYALSNLTTLLNLEALFQYNQAFSTLYTYLPQKMSRAKRLWRRASAIFVPSKIKELAIARGMIPHVPGALPPHVRLWDESPMVLYGGAADYTDLSALSPHEIFQNNTYMDQLLDNIEKAIWVWEGNVTSSAAAQEDVIAIKDMIDMLNDVVPGLFTQGLPSEREFPGLIADPTLFNDWYCGALFTYDTFGLLGDKILSFPVIGMSEFNSLIPVKGWGSPSKDDFNLFGAPKAGYLGNTLGLRYSPQDGGVGRRIGCVVPGGSHFNPNYWSMYTREDGWAIVNTSVDFGDATSLQTFLNVMHPFARHIWFTHLVAAQLTTAMEFHFVDGRPVDWQFFMDPNDLGPNHAMELSVMMGVPYIK